MADIKTRQINKGSVKTIDRAANLSSHVRSATVQTKEQAEHGREDDSRSASSYASDNTMLIADRAAHDAGSAAVSSAGQIHRRIVARQDRIDVKTKVDMIRRSRGMAEGSKASAKAGTASGEHAAAVTKSSRSLKPIRNGKSIKTAAAANAKNAALQAKKIDNAKKAQVIAKNTGKAAVKGVKKTVEVTLKALRAAIESTKALVTTIAAGGWIAVVVILICSLFGAAFYFFGDDSSANYTPVSPEVEAYTPLIEKYAAEYGIPEYVDLIKAVMMQESGGKGSDPMQCSKSPYNKKYSNKPGGIKDPEYSID